MPQRRTVAFSMLRKMRFSTVQADQDHREQAGEHGGYVEHVLVLVDVPAEPALARGDAEHELGGDQRAPGEGPADLEAGQDRGERGRDQDQDDEADALEAAVAPDHAQRVGHGAEARVGVERHRPQHGVHQHEDDGGIAEAEPDQRQRQERDGRQRVEGRREGLEEVVAEPEHHGERGQGHRQEETGGVALEQQHHRVRHLLRDVAAGDAAPQGLQRRGEGRHQQRIVEPARVELPGDGYDDQDEGLPEPALIGEPLPDRERLLDHADVATLDHLAQVLGADGRIGNRQARDLRRVRAHLSHGVQPPAPRCGRQRGRRGCGRTASRRSWGRRHRCRRC